MKRRTHTELADFIWSICNLLRGPYKRNEYRKVILPLTVLRRFDCLLAFTEEDRLFFQQIKEKACNSEQVVQTALANPLDKFQLGIKKVIEELMIERMGENDAIVTRYMADKEFQGSAFPILAREIFEAVRGKAESDSESG